MATKFLATDKDSTGDYTSVQNALTGLANNLTLSTIKVFSISAYSSPTISAGDTVLGQTSLATGVCVLVNIARTQILIKTIAVASFQSGEVVQKTADASKTVTLSNAGDSPIVSIQCYAKHETTPITTTGWTTNSTNYFEVVVVDADRTAGVWNTAKWYIDGGVFGNPLINITANFSRWKGLQINHTGGGSAGVGIYVNSSTATNPTIISESIVKGCSGSGFNLASLTYCINCLSYSNDGAGFICGGSADGHKIYNCEAVSNAGRGFVEYYNAVTFTNCLAKSNTTADFAKDGSASNPVTTYCASSDATADDWGGAGNRISQTFTFVGGTDYRITSADAGARNYGVSLSGDATYPFSVDVAGTARPQGSAWDIGFFEVVESATITGTGSRSLTHMTYAGTGKRGMPGTGTRILPKLTFAGVGMFIRTGTGAFSLKKLTFAGTGLLRHNGTGSRILPAVAFSGAGKLHHTGSGAFSLKIPVFSGTASEIITGTGEWDLPSLAFSGAGTVHPNATVAFNVLKLTFSATGIINHVGSGAFSLVKPVFSGTASEVITGTGARILPSAVFSGAGLLIHNGTATRILPSLSFSATGKLHHVGSGAFNLKKLIFSGTAEELITGTGAFDLKKLTFAASGKLHHVGTGSRTLPSLTFVSSGHFSITGVGAFSLVKPAFAGTAEEVISGTGTRILPKPTFSGAGVRVINGTCAFVLPFMTFIGSPGSIILGTISFSLKKPAFAVTATKFDTTDSGETTRKAPGGDEFIDQFPTASGTNQMVAPGGDEYITIP